MSKVEIRQKRRIQELEDALRPFAEVKVDGEGDAVWLYRGHSAVAQEPPHLHPQDFLMAQVRLGVAQ
ncbi:MAG: hypothetical protein V3S55_09940 [Nitrospiraceae bacterium]